MTDNSWVLYILECKDGTLYTGITNNLDARILAHENGLGAKYTKGRGPFKLIYKENCDSRSIATKREMQVKSLTRRDKVALAIKIN